MSLPVSSDLVLRTRIQIPRIRPRRVERARLLDRLHESAWSRLTLVSAPAGFGKTTLLASWAQSAGFPVAWLALEDADNSLESVLRYLASALGRVLPGAGEAALEMLASRAPLQPEAFLSSLINDLSEVQGPLALVIDDYHLIQSAPVHQALEYFLERMPDCLRVLIAGRADPPLALARLRARGELVELRGADLRFTSQEAADFLNQVMGLRLSPADVEAVENRTEGWATGLQLAAISLRDQPDPGRFLRVFTGSHRYVLDYLVEEVLHRQPDEIQAFLLRTSVLERMCAGLCDVLVGTGSGINAQSGNWGTEQPGDQEPQFPDRAIANSLSSSQSILEYLDRNNLFIQPLDDERRWFRYHTLFADLLRFRLEQSDAQLVRDLHRRAAAWLESHQMVHEAVRNYIAGGDLASAARLVEMEGQADLNTGLINQLISWMDSLPTAVFDTLPRLHVLYAWGMMSTNQINGIESRLRLAEQGLEKYPPDRPMPGSACTPDICRSEIASSRAIVASISGDFETAIRQSEQALEGKLGDPSLRASVGIGLGVAYRALGDNVRAEQAWDEAARAALQSETYAVGLASLCNRGNLLQEMGDLSGAEACFREALSVQARVGALPVTSLAYNGLSNLAYERGDLPAALAAIRSAVEMDDLWGNQEIQVINQGQLARVLLACGETEAGWQALEKAQSLAKVKPLNAFDQDILEDFQVSLWVLFGRPELARQWLAHTPEIDLETFGYFDEHRLLCQAGVLTSLGIADRDAARLEKAIRVLDALLPKIQAEGRQGYITISQVLLALASNALGKTDEALKTLEEALGPASEQKYQDLFIRYGPAMAALLRAARPSSKYCAYIDELLAAFPRSSLYPTGLKSSPPVAPARRAEGLSPREAEVLRLVVAGLSNQEIAARLFLAPGTVKRHLHNIFEKLGVTTRPQAIVKARDLHLD